MIEITALAIIVAGYIALVVHLAAFNARYAIEDESEHFGPEHMQTGHDVPARAREYEGQ